MFIDKVDKEREYSYKPLAQWWKTWDNGEEKRHSVCFEQMREKDKVLCYEADSRSFKAVSEVHSKFDKNTKMSLVFKRKINVDLDTLREYYDDILALNAKIYSPFAEDGSNLFYGSFLR